MAGVYRDAAPSCLQAGSILTDRAIGMEKLETGAAMTSPRVTNVNLREADAGGAGSVLCATSKKF